MDKKIRGSVLAKYEIVSAVMLANPGKDNQWLSEKLKMNESSMRTLMNNEDFQKVLLQRRERVCGEIIKEAQIANHKIHLQALERAEELLPDMEDANVIKLLDVTGKNTGLQKDKHTNVAVNNNFTVQWLGEEKVVSEQ